jgi:hypothetical protein
MQFLSNEKSDISDTIETLSQLALNFCYKRANMVVDISTIVKHQSNIPCVTLNFIVIHFRANKKALRRVLNWNIDFRL